MPRRNVNCRSFWLLIFILTVICGICAQDRGGSSDRWRVKASAHETLASLEATPRAPIGAGRSDDLRWPDFSHQSADLENFYARSGNAPAWLRGGQPTPQALQMIDIMREADGEAFVPRITTLLAGLNG